MNDLGEGFITFTDFQKQLRELERHLDEPKQQLQVQTTPQPSLPSPPPQQHYVYWIAHEGKGLCDQKGMPLLFASIEDADDFIADDERLFGARVYRWETVK